MVNSIFLDHDNTTTLTLLPLFQFVNDSSSSALKVLNRSTDGNYDNEKEDPQLYRGLKYMTDLLDSCPGQKREILMKIRDQKNTDLFRAFVHFFLQHTRMKNTWLYERSTQRLGRFFTIHDEALTILILMNSWGEFEELSKTNASKISKKVRKTLYTNCLLTKDGKVVLPNDENIVDTSIRTRKTKGWTKEGMQMYGKILNHLKTIRNDTYQVSMENALLEEYRLIDNGTRKRKRDDGTDSENDDDIEILDVFNFEFAAI